jgi:ribonuclease P protein component
LSGSNQKFNSYNCIYSSKNFRLFYKPSSKSGLEISISKKYFRLAVKRNKIKRHIKEIFRSLNIVIPGDGVVIFSVFRPFGELSYEKALLEVDEAVKSLSGDLSLK